MDEHEPFAMKRISLCKKKLGSFDHSVDFAI
jgi:hypothetical protein